MPKVSSQRAELVFKPGLCNYKADVLSHQRKGKDIFILLAKHTDFVLST